MAAADVLVHPSRLDVTGQVILEAVVNGLPSVATSVCGFAEHVRASGSGIVLPEPFTQSAFEAALKRLRDPTLAAQMSAAGIEYGRKTEPVTGLEQAADIIERSPLILQAEANCVPRADRAATTAVPRPYAPISLILATYNRADALDAVLRALARQLDKRFEIVVADDGSSQDTADLLERWRPRLGVPLTHIWHEDNGFRTRRNPQSRDPCLQRGSYCIFLDGDCIPRNDFIATHRELAEPGWFVVGNRVLMSEQLTAQTLGEGLEPERWEIQEFARQHRRGAINRMAPLMHMQLGPVRKLLRQNGPARAPAISRSGERTWI